MVFLSVDDVGGSTIICRETLARLEAQDDSSDDSDEELEGVVEIFSLDSEASTTHMDSCYAVLRARHKGKVTAAEKGKGKVVEASPDLTLTARLPPTGVVIGASPTNIAFAAAHHPRLRKRNYDSPTPVTAKKSKLSDDVASEDASSVDKAFIFGRLEQLIPASDLQAMHGVSPSYLLQSAAFHCFQVIVIVFSSHLYSPQFTNSYLYFAGTILRSRPQQRHSRASQRL